MVRIAEDGDGVISIGRVFWGPGVSWIGGSLVGHLHSRDGLFADRLDRLAIDGDSRVWVLATSGRVGVDVRDRLLQ